MRRSTRTIVALATPVLAALAIGCAAKKPAPSHPSDSYAPQYEQREQAQAVSGGEKAVAERDQQDVAVYDMEDEADSEPMPEPEPVMEAMADSEPMDAPMPMEAESTGSRRRARGHRSRRSRKSSRTARRGRGKRKDMATSPGMSGGAVAATPPPTVATTPAPPPAHDTEGYDHIAENDFIAVADDPRSTFSIDVDTASYSNTRRFIREGRLPPADAVRIEELVNYFEYDYPQPTGDDPFSVNTEVAPCPWSPDHRLVHLGLQGKTVAAEQVPARNLVFLLDVSGSMSDADKLPLLKRGLTMLADQVRSQDRVSIVVYAGASGVVLEPTSDVGRIKDALDRLNAGGSTNGGAGIELAYELAMDNFVKGGINRVLLATDGDFNVGVTNRGALVRLIERKRRSGVFLSVLGFGRGNLQDSTMEQLADKGNGNYAYIDSASEAHKVLVEQSGATLMTIAKDVKIQVEFNPAEVAAYRLVGYENRKLAHRDFNDDTKDAGEIGAGHTVTALYEVVPVGRGVAPQVDPLEYQDEGTTLSAKAQTGELMTIKLRYKRPRGVKSKLLSVPVTDSDRAVDDASADFRFSAGVAELGLLLRGSKWRGQATWGQAYALAQSAQGRDPHGRRAEMLSLLRQAAALAGEDLDTRADQPKLAH